MDHEDKPFSLPETGEDPKRDSLMVELLEGLDPENIQRRGDSLEIPLWPAWPEMLESLADFGEVLAVTGNNAAVLGLLGAFPQLEQCPTCRQAHSPDGRVVYDLFPWHSAVANVAWREDGWSRRIEFRDEGGTTLHKVCLTDKSKTESFVDWVLYHQATPAYRAPELPFAPHRWRTVQQRHWCDYDEVETVSPLALNHLLTAAQKDRQPLGIVVGNEGAIQSATMIPESIRMVEDWHFVTDQTTGLHFHWLSLEDIIVHHTSPHEDAPPLATLKCFDEHGLLRLAITSPHLLPADTWNEFLRASVKLS